MSKKKHKTIQTKIEKYSAQEKPKTTHKFFSKKNKPYIVLGIIILLILIIFAVIYYTNTKKTIEDAENLSDQVVSEIQTLNVSFKLDELLLTGKPSLIVFAGTYCGHCQKLVPQLETEIWDNYKDKANIWIQVIDGKDGQKFDVDRIAQGYNPNFEYDEIMGECSYVPAYVVLDKAGKQILRSCGSEKTIDDIKQALDSQLN